MELSTVERQVILAVEAIGPCGLTPLLPRCPSLESKVALRNVLAQLDNKGAVKLQSNNQFAVVKAWLKEARAHNLLTAPKTFCKPQIKEEPKAELKTPAAAEKAPEVTTSAALDDIPVMTAQSKSVSNSRAADPVAELMKDLPDGVQIGLSRYGMSVSWSGFVLEPAVEELSETLAAILTIQQHIVSGCSGQAV